MAPYISVWPTMERIRAQQNIARESFDRMSDEVGQMLNGHTDLEHMSEDQKQCFWEFHVWIRAFPAGLSFPGDMQPLDTLVQQNRTREKATKEVAGRENDLVAQHRERMDLWNEEHLEEPHEQAITKFRRRQEDLMSQNQEPFGIPVKSRTTKRQRQASRTLSPQQTSMSPISHPGAGPSKPPNNQVFAPSSLTTECPPITRLSRVEVVIPYKKATDILQSAATPANPASDASARHATSRSDTSSVTPETSISPPRRSPSLFVEDNHRDPIFDSLFGEGGMEGAEDDIELQLSDSEVEIIASENERPSYPSVPDYSKLPVIEFTKPEVRAQLAQSTEQVKQWQKKILARYGPEELTRVSNGTKVDISAAVSLLTDFRMWLYINKKDVSTYGGAKTELYTKDSALVREWIRKTADFSFSRTFEGGVSSNAESRKRKGS